jgi:hypothetical protein
VIALLAGGLLVQLLAVRPARAERPDQVTARRACEAALLAEEGHGRPSRAACYESPLLGTQPEDFRNRVASLMSPSARPSLDDLVVSALNADAAVNGANNQPWGYLARCDLARRLGNADLMEACLADLKRVAPGDLLTKRALGYPHEGAPIAVWILRALLLLGLAATLGHALWRRRRLARPALATERPVSGVALGILGFVFVALGTGVVRAQETVPPEATSEFKINDADPAGNLPSAEVMNKKPLQLGYFIQELLTKAEKAGKNGDHAAEARFYLALTKIAPKEAYAPRKLCEAYEAAGDMGTAVLACRTAVGRPGANVSDATHFIALVLATKGPLPAAERTELEAVIKHLESSQVELGTLPTMLRCEVDLRFKDFAALETCTKELLAKAPEDPKTISLQWALAVEKSNRADALALIDRARGAGMNEAGIAQMVRATRTMTLRRIGLLVVLFAGMAGGVFAVVRFRREAGRRRLAV